MQNITLGEFYEILKFIVGFTGLGATIYFSISKTLDKKLNPIWQQIRRNELMRYFSVLKRDGKLDSDEKVHLKAIYDEYIKTGNSYIKDLYEYWKKEGKL